MAKTISQRISLEGSEDIRKRLEELGKAGAQAFKQIQDAAAKPITDPSQINRTKQALDQLAQTVTQLSPQFQKLARDTSAFGQAGAQAGQQTASGLDQANQAIGQTSAGFKAATSDANNLGVRIGVVSGLVSALTAKLLGMAGAFREALSVSNLLKGVQDSSKAISDQADKLQTNIGAWTEIRRAMAGAGVSSEDFTKSVGNAGGILESARKELEAYVQANGKLKEAQDASKATITIYNGSMKQLIEVMEHGGTIALPKMAAELRDFGVSLKSIQSTNRTEAWRELATIIGRIEDPAKRAAAGVKYFGDTWEKTIKILSNIKGDLEKDPLKAGRELTEGQVKGANKAAAAWKDLDTAIRATKDQIGALFSAGSQMKAEWLTELVDRSRELLKTWVGLSDVGRADFMKGIGDDATGTVFKTAIAFAQQLAGLWRDVLVPAGEKLMGIIGEIAGSFEGVSKSQVAAFFITAAAAALTLAIALKGIGLLLTPLSLLAGLFSPLGAVLLAAGAAAMLFWEQISAGAKLAASLIPSELALINEAIKKLFAGDFAGFWTDFSTAAVSAFQTISATFQQMISETIAQTPWAQALVDGIKQIAADAPGAIQLVAESFIALGQAATTVASIINTIFGTELTGTGVALLVIITSITGGFVALAAIATILGAAIGAVASAVTIFGGAAVAVTAAIFALAITIQSLVTNWDAVKAAGILAWNAITDAIGGLIAKLGELATAAGGAIWNAFKSAGEAAINGVMGLVDRLIAKLQAVGSAIRAIAAGGGTPGSVTPIPGNARGGWIGGRGTGTSDSNLSWLSRGEYVLPARVVRRPGMLAFLEALRRSGGIPGFAEGGAVGGGGGGSKLGWVIRWIDDVKTGIDQVLQGLNASTDKIAKIFLEHRNGLRRLTTELHGGLQGVVNSIESTARALVEQHRSLGRLQDKLETGGNASGGYIRGPGSATSDSILSRLSNGEFVLSARAVRYWGVDFMRALNGLQMPGFSMGGLVPAMPHLPRFAEGGLVGATAHLGTVDLRTDHGSVSMMATPNAAAQLQRLAVQKRITATGRKPGFVGG